MTELTFAQSERRSFVGPILIAIAVLAAVAFAVYRCIPHRVADLTVTHTAIFPTHTVLKTESKLIGHQEDAEDALYVLATVRIDNKLRDPLFISDITASLTSADDTVTTATAFPKSDLDDLYLTFPALKPLASAPLLRESSIQPGGRAEGMVLLSFPITEADWNNRKSATVTIDFYHWGTFTATIPKP